MKILNLIGSPRKKGNTAILAQHLIDQLDTDRFEVDTQFLNDVKIGPCIDCRACKKGDLKCVVMDDMQPIYTKLEASDIFIFGTPIYWFAPSAQMKCLIDRLRPFYGTEKLKGKKGALLLPAGDGEKDCDLTIDMFRRIFKSLHIEYLDAVTAKAYDIGEVKKDDVAMAKAIDLATRINAL